ncbi:CDP-diacylglycerol--glycerol-3-phosphate 3-phosphatidyltransferase [Mariniflexile rhizosphaerae]|uniref:CDP-alcohol phosphatidyltransferase family protein n=1 Tax=unclassified Mariniflexile TaxID=2643887 RepID=UPI000E33029E|nr:CDP-alcohol phosphatidyltransferase family protein [Mariniflexile sp. TRM1-10]AXP82250.1 CDP-diacylglycerol--glycerol-3-phosphate 3-phosphatidyltransferase [Mariniflexile sp. TRM1-10]
MFTFKNFNIADWFSFYRIVAVPLLILLIILDERLIFTCFLMVSYLTDAIDGYLARKLKITSARGSQLDSFGDQLTLVMGLIGLFYFEVEFIKSNISIIIIVLSPYIAQMILAYYKYGKATAFHTYLAKLSAVLQGVFILWALFLEPNYVLFYMMIVFGLLETIEEIILIFMYDEWVSDVKGLYWASKDKRRLNKKKSK